MPPLDESRSFNTNKNSRSSSTTENLLVNSNRNTPTADLEHDYYYQENEMKRHQYPIHMSYKRPHRQHQHQHQLQHQEHTHNYQQQYPSANHHPYPPYFQEEMPAPHHGMAETPTSLRSHQASAAPTPFREHNFHGEGGPHPHSHADRDASYPHPYQYEPGGGHSAVAHPSPRRYSYDRPVTPSAEGAMPPGREWCATPRLLQQQQQQYAQLRRHHRNEYYFPPPPPAGPYPVEEYYHRHPYETWQEGLDAIPPPPHPAEASAFCSYPEGETAPHYYYPAFDHPLGPPPPQAYHRTEAADGDDDEEKGPVIPDPEGATGTATPRRRPPTPSSSRPLGDSNARRVTPPSANAAGGLRGSRLELRRGHSPSDLPDDVSTPERPVGAGASTASTPPTSNTSHKTCTGGGGPSGPAPADRTVVKLQENDVVCGRGAPTSYHVGNEIFRCLVADYSTSYFCAKRSDKPLIALKVLDVLTDRGARFVRREKNRPAGSPSPGNASCWVVVDRKLAYEKVCQSLREGAPEVQRQMLSSSQKIREAVRNEHNQEKKLQQQQQQLEQGQQYFQATSSNSSLADYGSYNVVASVGPGDHEKENGYRQQH